MKLIKSLTVTSTLSTDIQNDVEWSLSQQDEQIDFIHTNYLDGCISFYSGKPDIKSFRDGEIFVSDEFDIVGLSWVLYKKNLKNVTKKLLASV